MFLTGKQASRRGQLSHQPLQGISHRPARADEARENTWFFQAIPDPEKSASLQAARVLDVKTKQPRKEGGHLWVPLAVPGCPRPLPPAKDRVGDWRWLLPPDTPLTLPPSLSLESLSRPSGLCTIAASVPSLVPASSSLQTFFLPWSEVAVYFSSCSFLRLRWHDKVLGGEPNPRFQGCHSQHAHRKQRAKKWKGGREATNQNPRLGSRRSYIPQVQISNVA